LLLHKLTEFPYLKDRRFEYISLETDTLDTTIEKCKKLRSVV
jgi:hypothetical protein